MQVGLSRRQVHAWLRRRRISQPQPQASDVKSTSPASNIEVIALEEDSDEDEKQVNVGVKQGKEGGKDYKKLSEEKCEEEKCEVLMVQRENNENNQLMLNTEVKMLKSKVEAKEADKAQQQKLLKAKETEINGLKAKTQDVVKLKSNEASLKAEIDQKNVTLKAKEKELKAHKDTLAVRSNAIKQLEKKAESQEKAIKENVKENGSLVEA